MKMKALLLLSALTFMTPVYSCPIEGQDKEQLLSELCNIDDGKWESNRLNEMIIMLKFGKLPSEKNIKGNKTMAAVTCNLEYL